jgi:hypothetical protein
MTPDPTPILAAQRLWPLDNLFDRVKDDGRADSALLAWWFVRSNR